MKRNTHLVEIEAGGSWIRFTVFNEKNKKIYNSRIPSVSLSNFPRIFAWRLRKFLPAKKLVIGAKGVWTKKEKKNLQILMHPFAKRVIVLSDVEFAYQKIFREKPGILLIAGTGSIAYGRNAQGKIARAGGLGPQKGDEGSGYWIGREWLKNLLCGTGKPPNANILPNKVRKIAAQAPKVIQKAKAGDSTAQRILTWGWEELVKLVEKVSKKLKFQRPIPLALYGGLFKNQFFQKGFLETLNFKRDGKYRVQTWQ